MTLFFFLDRIRYFFQYRRLSPSNSLTISFALMRLLVVCTILMVLLITGRTCAAIEVVRDATFSAAKISSVHAIFNKALYNAVVDCTDMRVLLLYNNLLCHVEFVNAEPGMSFVLIDNQIFGDLLHLPRTGGDLFARGNQGDAEAPCPHTDDVVRDRDQEDEYALFDLYGDALFDVFFPYKSGIIKGRSPPEEIIFHQRFNDFELFDTTFEEMDDPEWMKSRYNVSKITFHPYNFADDHIERTQEEDE